MVWRIAARRAVACGTAGGGRSRPSRILPSAHTRYARLASHRPQDFVLNDKQMIVEGPCASPDTSPCIDTTSAATREYIGKFLIKVPGARHDTKFADFLFLDDYYNALSGVSVWQCPATGIVGCVEYERFRSPLDVVRARVAPRFALRPRAARPTDRALLDGT